MGNFLVLLYKLPELEDLECLNQTVSPAYLVLYSHGAHPNISHLLTMQIVLPDHANHDSLTQNNGSVVGLSTGECILLL